MPAFYIKREQLLNEIIAAILTSDTTPTIGTTVTIRGLGGTGKSTLVKAACHEQVMKKHFPGGFLWISFIPPVASTTSILKSLYKALTNENIDSHVDATFLEGHLRSLVAKSPNPILVILDNVWTAEDAMTFIDIFSSCKIVLTTRKRDINAVIPAKKCFDIDNMQLNEAVQLLTWDIIEIEHLSSNDCTAINALAKDLYCWPLLLALVHGQFYVHCIELGETPTEAISLVQHKLFDKGLTAFDSRSDNRNRAVKASITSSLELLQDNEEKFLFTIISSMGIGSYVSKKSLYEVTSFNTEEFGKLSMALWSHGLINFNHVTLPTFSVEQIRGEKISCIEIHEIIAQYIIDEMPYTFCRFISDIDIKSDLGAVYCNQMMQFKSNFTKEDKEDNDKITMLFFSLQSYIDEVLMPFFIRSLVVYIRVFHVSFFTFLDSLIENHADILETHTMLKLFQSTQPIPLRNAYRAIKDNCKTLQTLLASNRHADALMWTSQYWRTHPLKAIIDSTNEFADSLQKECNENLEIVDEINSFMSKFDYSLIFHMLEFLIKIRRDFIQLVLSEYSSSSIYSCIKTMKEFSKIPGLQDLATAFDEIIEDLPSPL